MLSLSKKEAILFNVMTSRGKNEGDVGLKLSQMEEIALSMSNRPPSSNLSSMGWETHHLEMG